MATEKNNFEMYFEWWLDDLKEEGFITEYIREPQTFILKPEVEVSYPKGKKILKIAKQAILNPITYTPDYKVAFTQKGVNILFLVISEMGSLSEKYNRNLHFLSVENLRSLKDNVYILYFDVKAPSKAIRFSSGLSSAREFPIKQRLMYDLKGVFVNKVVPIGSSTSLFEKTFYPKRYFQTDKERGLRKGMENKKNIKDFLKLWNQ